VRRDGGQEDVEAVGPAARGSPTQKPFLNRWALQGARQFIAIAQLLLIYDA
jgi:hypothetical protein